MGAGFKESRQGFYHAQLGLQQEDYPADLTRAAEPVPDMPPDEDILEDVLPWLFVEGLGKSIGREAVRPLNEWYKRTDKRDYQNLCRFIGSTGLLSASALVVIDEILGKGDALRRTAPYLEGIIFVYIGLLVVISNLHEAKQPGQEANQLIRAGLGARQIATDIVNLYG